MSLIWTPAMALLSDNAEAAGLDLAFASALVSLAWAGGPGDRRLGGSPRFADATTDAAAYVVIAGLFALTLVAVFGRRRRGRWSRRASGRTLPTMSRTAVAAVLVALAAARRGRGTGDRQAFSLLRLVRSGGKHAARFCFEGHHPVAVLRAFDKARVRYRFCFRKAGDRQHCRDRRTHKPGSVSRTRFDLDGSGKYKLAWFATAVPSIATSS